MKHLGRIALFVAGMSAPAAWSQDTTLGEDFQTGLDQLLIEPLNNNGLSADRLQPRVEERRQPQPGDITKETRMKVSAGSGVNLRALDRLTGDVQDLHVAVGQRADFGRISIYLADCRYPQGNRSGDAYAYLMVHAEGTEAPVFSGWMVASSPALNAMDHPRYDIWPLTCSAS